MCAVRAVVVIESVKHPNTRARVVGWTWSPTFYSNYVDEETARAPTPDRSSSFATASILRTKVEILYPIYNPKYVHGKVEHMEIALRMPCPQYDIFVLLSEIYIIVISF